MNSLANLVNSSKGYASYIALGICVIGLILAITMIVIMVVLSNKNPSPKLPKKASTINHDIHDIKTAFDLMRTEQIPLVSSYFMNIFYSLGFVKIGPIITSFLKIMRLLKKSTFDRNWRYRLPLYLVIGPKSSGKTTLLDGLRFMNLPGEEKNHEDTWKLFDNSILFEVPSNTFFTESMEFWNFLCKVFRYFRPRRPLDGIILTIPADCLIENSSELIKIARETAYKISSAQNAINMHLPIYLISTNSDKIKYFYDFCAELSISARNQIIGWSVDNYYEKTLPVNWLSLFKEAVHIGLRKATLSFAKEKRLSEKLNHAIFASTGFYEIIDGLKEYVIALTNGKNKTNSIFLRGIYLTAVVHEKASTVPIVQASILNPNANNIKKIVQNDIVKNGVCFAEDLFKEKILVESNLASPIAVMQLHASKEMWIKRGIYASVAATFVIGWNYGTNSINKEITNLDSVLRAAVGLMKRIAVIEGNIKDKTDQQIMNSEIKKMLQLLSNVKKKDMFSIFVPASWFSQIQNRITSTIGIIFDSVATKAIFLDLNLSAKNVGSNYSNDEENSVRVNPFEISSVQSFIQFKKYVQEIKRLERMEGEYNRLRKLEDPEALNAITKEIFKETFNISNAINNRESSSKFVAPQFNLDDFHDRIYLRTKELFSQFISEIFDHTIEKIFIKLCEDINVLGQSSQNPKDIYSAENINKLNAKIERIIELVGSNKFNWIKAKEFKPTKEYSEVFNDIENTRILGYQISKELSDLANAEFSKLKNKLATCSTVFTGKVFNEKFDGHSSGFMQFASEIKKIAESNFAIKVAEKSLTTNIPSDQILNWDIDTIREAVRLIEKVEIFEKNQLKTMRPTFQHVYSSIVRKMIYPVIINILARAQNLEDAPNMDSSSLRESFMKKHAHNLNDLSQNLSKIIMFMNSLISKGVSDFGFHNLIISQALDLLKTADSLFELETPYSVGNELFNDWSGDAAPKFAGSNDPNLVKKYLASQYSRVKFLSKEIANPAIVILTLDCLSNRVSQMNEINKWIEISNQIDAFELSKPGNSIAALESFINGIISGATINTVKIDPSIHEISNQSGDYFTNQRSKIAKALINRANNIDIQKAYNYYNNLANFYNTHIADKGPFSNSYDEISLQAIDGFVRLFESFDVNVEDILKQKALEKNISQDVITFISTVPSIVSFLKLWIEHSKSTDINNSLVAFQIVPKINRDNEQNANILLGRKIMVNGQGNDETGNVIIFHNGDNVDVELKFVESQSIQLHQPNMQNASLHGRSVVFSYGGLWGFFSMVENHKITRHNTLSASGAILQFAAPIRDENGQDTETKIYMKVTPMMKNASGAWQAFSIPDFPGKAELLQF